MEVRVFSTAPKKPASAGFFFFSQSVSSAFGETEMSVGANMRMPPRFILQLARYTFRAAIIPCRRLD
ncbi:hypothetical protein CFBP5877_06465 [Agrobacterium tumefaciens]|uniref:Uncharacterized protein n=1 Tax=Agrobacterium tumefaciens TaxID=358 RepID=A0AAE6B9J3_AGRTU|nr:hypothetical protein CFBP5499_06935 [Agrobacterium tumefaciens]QCL78759.1 hypothetical protein CFBP5877_06465 [Agrobacterium tumefaciens]